MSAQSHVPIRTCLGCGERAPQIALRRFVRDAQQRLVLDPRRRLGGRGGYIHVTPSCWERFTQRKGHLRSLGATADRPARLALVEQLRLGDRPLRTTQA